MQPIYRLVEANLKTHNNLFELAIHYVNYYLTFVSPLSENSIVIKKYADEMWIDLIEQLPSIYHNNLKNNEQYSLDQVYDWKKSLLKAKINTYDKRKSLFFKWVNNLYKSDQLVQKLIEVENQFKQDKSIVLENSLNELSLLISLIKKYPSTDDLIDVKKELGLTKSIEELNKELMVL